MSNMPILSNNAHAPNKTASTANQSANESAIQEMQAFGDVLARQISDKAGVETKAIDILTTDELPLATTKDVKTENIIDATNASLPTDMLATLLPVAAAIAHTSSIAQNASAVSGNELGKLQSPAGKDTPDITLNLNHLSEHNSFLPSNKGKTIIEMEPIRNSSSTISRAVVVASAPYNRDTPLVDATIPQQEKMEVSVNKSFALDLNEIVSKGEIPQFQKTPQAPLFITDMLPFANERELHNKLDVSVSTAAATSVMTQTLTVQSSMMNVSPIVAPATQLVIDTPVTQRQWGNEFNQKITWMATQQDQHAELHLNPAQLGPVDVVIKVSGDQATAQFTSAHAAVREVIEQSIPKLREMLADNGIMLGNTTVSDQAPREQRGEFGNQRQTAPNGRLLETAPSNMSDTRVATPVSRHNGMVDTFA